MIFIFHTPTNAQQPQSNGVGNQSAPKELACGLHATRGAPFRFASSVCFDSSRAAPERRSLIGRKQVSAAN